LYRIRTEYALAGKIGGATPFIRNRGSGDFVHLLGTKWPFLAAEREDETSDMFDELRQMLPLRYKNAENDRQRLKIAWMSEYVNDTIMEQNLPAEWKVALPQRGE
jgi:hypothetical protein